MNSVEKLAAFVDGAAAIVQMVDDLVRDDLSVTPPREGWTWVLNPEETPEEWLWWLGQFAGVRPRSGLSAEDKRILIREAPPQRRGSLQAIRGAARQHLTGNRYVNIEERVDGDGNPHAYWFQVTTFTEQTPDPGRVEAAILAAKPAGLLFGYSTVTAASYDARVSEYGHLTYDDTPGGHETYTDAAEWLPPGI